jgi:hypothetical protein
MDTKRKPITKFIEKVCTKRYKKSWLTIEETPGRMRPKQARNGLFPWKRDYGYDDHK